MKNFLFYFACILLLLASVFIFYITNIQTEMNMTIELMKKNKVKFDFDNMVVFRKDSLNEKYNATNLGGYRYVIYLDSIMCSKCEMNRLSMINTVINNSRKDNLKNVEFLLIFDPINSDSATFSINYNLSSLTLPAYLDITHSFKTNNTFIPKDTKYHSFLVDPNDSIVLLGNPIYNDNVESALYNILQK